MVFPWPQDWLHGLGSDGHDLDVGPVHEGPDFGFMILFLTSPLHNPQAAHTPSLVSVLWICRLALLHCKSELLLATLTLMCLPVLVVDTGSLLLVLMEHCDFPVLCTKCLYQYWYLSHVDW